MRKRCTSSLEGVRRKKGLLGEDKTKGVGKGQMSLVRLTATTPARVQKYQKCHLATRLRLHIRGANSDALNLHITLSQTRASIDLGSFDLSRLRYEVVISSRTYNPYVEVRKVYSERPRVYSSAQVQKAA